MMRSFGFGLALLIVLVASLYGVVLNGFGLFAPEGGRGLAAVSEQAGDTAPQPAPVTQPAPKPERDAPVPGLLPSASRDPDSRRAAPLTLPPSSDTLPPSPGTAPAATAGSARPDDDPLPPSGRVARNVTPPNVLQRPTARYAEPASETGPPPEPARPRRFHRVVVADAGTLRAGDTVIRLAGIVPVGADQTCTDASGREWPCGRAAAAALRMLIRNRAVDCALIAERDGVSAATCSVGLQDINGWLVAHGWAEPDADTYAAEAQAARRDRRGVHAAEWRAGDAVTSGAASLSAFTAPELPRDSIPGLPAPLAPDAAQSRQAPRSAAPPDAPVDLAPPAVQQ
ncbi:hypothetical protein EDC22_10185 [Tepidamorphus gemmatus]|uniref:Endonuclease YncB(Thermonuclease family) n=1 Tax=Tepidamorphus gemmatus TaxID=747076 RepID=A0A4R3MIQ0_9HYPH|nr:thermonuclease family protein [Tepidamorphus gemmatus]TCT13224.1 hypothetical protein EDC22_10185 [Tepidamorphus gemmatus]